MFSFLAQAKEYYNPTPDINPCLTCLQALSARIKRCRWGQHPPLISRPHADYGGVHDPGLLDRHGRARRRPRGETTHWHDEPRTSFQPYSSTSMSSSCSHRGARSTTGAPPRTRAQEGRRARVRRVRACAPSPPCLSSSRHRRGRDRSAGGREGACGPAAAWARIAGNAVVGMPVRDEPGVFQL